MSDRSVVLPVGASVLVVTVDEILSGDLPRPRVYIGFAFAAIALSMLAGSVPQVAVPLAWLIFVAVLLSRGVNVFARFAAKPKRVQERGKA